MNEVGSLFGVLKQSAPKTAADAIERLARDGSDLQLNRINALAFAEREGLSEDDAIAAFLHASRLGLFDLSWNVLCPGCGGVLDAGTSLKSVESVTYHCQLCAAGYEMTLDEMVEVTFTVSPRVRRIAGHSPHTLSPAEYFRQIYWGSGIDLPVEDYFDHIDRFILETIELPPGEKGLMSLQLPEAFIIVFEPVTHAAQFIEVTGEPTRERQNLTLVFDRQHRHHEKLQMRPGPFRLSVENKAEVRTIPSICIANEELHHLLGHRRPFLTAKRLLSNQTFREIHRTDALNVGQRLKITSMTFLFTDLRGSTELYEKVGDLNAYELVQRHFGVIAEIVGSHSGAVVKTIGDAVMATFPTPDKAVAAAIAMREAMIGLNHDRGNDDLVLKIGIHEGPCIAVNLNERQDYFGQTVNIAARVQQLATPREIVATQTVLTDPRTTELLGKRSEKPVLQEVAIRGLAKEFQVFAIR